MGASIHRKVLLDEEFGKIISVGAVLVLKKVSFSFYIHHISIHAMNINDAKHGTLSNYYYYYFYFFQVAVFAPSRSAYYLNITLNNVVKVFCLLIFILNTEVLAKTAPLFSFSILFDFLEM